MMNPVGTNGYGFKFEADNSVSMLGGIPSMARSGPSSATGENICGGTNVKQEMSNFDAAEAAVARLGSIASEAGSNGNGYLQNIQSAQDVNNADDDSISSNADRRTPLKRKASSDPDTCSSDEKSGKNGKGKKKQLSNERREERNLREKERSLKITQQIHELRNLLSSGGVIVPKGTKSTILTEAANYIRLLQQHQYRSEMDRAQLVQEVQRIGEGAIGQKAAAAIRHVAAQNGVCNMANFKNGMPTGAPGMGVPEKPQDGAVLEALDEREYRCVFNSCSVGMAIATMGGSFIDCNQAFTQLSAYTKQELKAMTIFNLTSREDLQGAFDMMSRLISPSPSNGLDASGNIEESKTQPPVILRSAIKHRNDLGLSVSLIRGDDGVARYFNVTLVKLPSSPLGSFRPIPATTDLPADVPGQRQNLSQQTIDNRSQPTAMNKQYLSNIQSPQYTAG